MLSSPSVRQSKSSHGNAGVTRALDEEGNAEEQEYEEAENK